MLCTWFFCVLFPPVAWMRDGLSRWKGQAQLERARLRLPRGRGHSPSAGGGLGSRGQHVTVWQDTMGGAGGAGTERCGSGHFVGSSPPYFKLASSVSHWLS